MPYVSSGSTPSPVVRRRDLHRGGRRRGPGSGGARPRGGRTWLGRAAGTVVLALATAVGVGAQPAGPAPVLADASVGISSVTTPTAREVLAPGADGASSVPLPLADAPRRGTVVVSRSVSRAPLPGCDGQARPGGANGRLAAEDLCPLWDPAHALRADAAVALAELNLVFRSVFGRDLCLTDSYRPLAVQRRVAAAKPRLAATPGRSNHGWGLAVDLCAQETGDAAVMGWLGTVGPAYGWDNPPWARRGGVGPYEPWHWEFVPGTAALAADAA